MKPNWIEAVQKLHLLQGARPDVVRRLVDGALECRFLDGEGMFLGMVEPVVLEELCLDLYLSGYTLCHPVTGRVARPPGEWYNSPACLGPGLTGATSADRAPTRPK